MPPPAPSPRGAADPRRRPAGLTTRTGPHRAWPASPYRIDIAPASGAIAARARTVNFPRTLLPLPPGQVKQVTAVTMPASPGIGALTSRLLVQLATRMDHYTPAEAAPVNSGAGGAGHPAGPRTGRRPVAKPRRPTGGRCSPASTPSSSSTWATPNCPGDDRRSSSHLRAPAAQAVPGAGPNRSRVDPRAAAGGLPAGSARAGGSRPSCRRAGGTLGVSQRNYFSRVFRAAYGLPPHEYRLATAEPETTVMIER